MPVAPSRTAHARAVRQHPDRVEPVLAGEQRQVRVVVACLRRHRLPGLQRDVRRVAHHHVHGAQQVVEGGEGVAQSQVDVATGEVALGVGVRLRAQLHRVHLRVRDLVPDRRGDRTRARAQVHDHRRLQARGPLHGPPGEQFGLRPRHEHTGPHGQLDVAEGGGAGEVLQGLAGRAARHESGVRRGGLLGHLVDERQRAAGGPQDVGQEHGGVGRGAGHPGLVQGPRGVGDQLPAGGHAQSSRAARRAAMSASTHEDSTGSRAPSSTWSRL